MLTKFPSKIAPNVEGMPLTSARLLKRDMIGALGAMVASFQKSRLREWIHSSRTVRRIN